MSLVDKIINKCLGKHQLMIVALNRVNELCFEIKMHRTLSNRIVRLRR